MQVVFTTDPTPAVENPYCDKEIGHEASATADPNSFIILSIGADGNGNTIVHIGQDTAKNNTMFDYLQVTGLASTGTDVETGGVPEMGVKFATPVADGDGNITLEILWSKINWGGRWMVQNVKVPATATCATAVIPLPYKDEYDMNYALSSNGGTAWATSGTAANAIDGNTGTRWESEHKVDPQVFVVDMHAHCTFNTVQILWESAYAKSFTIDASNDSLAWTTIASVEDQTISPFPYTQTLDVTETSARYVRFTGIVRKETNYGYSFYEFRVFKAGLQILTTFEVKPAAAYSKIGVENALTITAKDQNGVAMNPGEITYVISPATAGAVSEGKYVAAEKGLATITATAGDKESQFTVFGVASDNLALSTNRMTDNKIIEQSGLKDGSAFDAYYTVDQDQNSVWQADTANGAGGTALDGWFVVDLADTFNIDMIAIKFEGACAKEYTLSFSLDNVNYASAHSYSGASGINAHTDMISTFAVSVARYVKFHTTEAATQWGVKIFDMQVFGTEYVPVYEPARTGLTEGAFGTFCSKKTVISYQGATFYQVDYIDKATSTLYFNEVDADSSLVAGKAYLFKATDNQIGVVTYGDEVDEPLSGDAARGFVAVFVDTPVPAPYTWYGIYGNKIQPVAQGVNIRANRAYIDYANLKETTYVQQGQPAPRRLAFGTPKGAATELQNIYELGQDGVQKIVLDGQVLILRNGQLYNVQGQLMK